jgi:hypothetical protein
MKQRSAPWNEVINRDLDRLHHAMREAAERDAIIDTIAEADAADRARLEARRAENARGRTSAGRRDSRKEKPTA